MKKDLEKIEQQLDSLEKKIDILITHSLPRQAETRPFQRPVERVMHKATCADCRKECEVPFRPREDRPVYCKECFSKRKSDNPFKPNNDTRPVETKHGREHARENYFPKPKRVKSKKSGGEKKWFPKKKKKRS